MNHRHFESIMKAYGNIKHIFKKTSLNYNKILSEKFNCNIFLKREDLQPVRSFKIRGAFNKIVSLTDQHKHEGVVCVSAGNHAQGVAYSCSLLDIQSDIFVPENTPLQKIQSIKKFLNTKSSLHICGRNFDSSLAKANDFSKKNNKHFIHPFNDFEVIYGQSTVAVEIFDEITPDIIVGSIGGGGLMSGISLYNLYNNTMHNTVYRGVDKLCKLYGVESKDCDAMKQSIEQNKIISLSTYDTFVDGAAVKQVGELTFDICKRNLTDILTVSNGRLCNTLLDLYSTHGIIAEPAGALSVSALDLIEKKELAGKNVVAIISGGNNDITRYPEMNDLALRYLNLKHYFIIKFSQNPGELKRFINSNILGMNDDITRFEYIKKTNRSYGQVLIGIEVSNSDNLHQIIDKLEINAFEFKYINNDELLLSYLI